MAHEHDPIFCHTKQIQTYESIRTIVEPDIQITAGLHRTITDALYDVAFIHVAERTLDLRNLHGLLIRFNLHRQSLDADVVRLEGAWSVKPFFIER